MTQLTVGQEGDKIVLVINNERICDMPVEIARELCQIVMDKVRRIEEIQHAEQIIRDQAILQRAGSPFGISSHPKIQEEAKKMAEWDSNLRRAMPLNGVEPKSIVGTPSLRRS